MKETLELARLASLHERQSAVLVQYHITVFDFCQCAGRYVTCQSGKFGGLSASSKSRYGGNMKTPNQLSRAAIEEFKVIYQEEFGEILSDDEVQEIAMRLLRFFGILNGDK
jgi:hypothetical protein